MLVSEWTEYFKNLKDGTGTSDTCRRVELYRALESLLKDPMLKKFYGCDLENLKYCLAQADNQCNVLFRQETESRWDKKEAR